MLIPKKVRWICQISPSRNYSAGPNAVTMCSASKVLHCTESSSVGLCSVPFIRNVHVVFCLIFRAYTSGCSQVSLHALLLAHENIFFVLFCGGQAKHVQLLFRVV